jgi:hypothetical protein
MAYVLKKVKFKTTFFLITIFIALICYIADFTMITIFKISKSGIKQYTEVGTTITDSYDSPNIYWITNSCNSPNTYWITNSENCSGNSVSIFTY